MPPYHEVLGDDFGTVVPGMFTDEPNFCSFHQEHPEISVPWTKGFARIFEGKFGYDLIPHLPSLFFDTGDYRKVRYHYWRAITEQFVEAYSKQIYEWCDAHNLKLTGHYLYEDSLQQQIPVSGAVMPHYEYMHYPGIDHLRRNIADLVTPKQLDSVVCQLGKERALSETYGCSGQNLSFEGRKWIGDWQCVLGNKLPQSAPVVVYAAWRAQAGLPAGYLLPATVVAAQCLDRRLQFPTLLCAQSG